MNQPIRVLLVERDSESRRELRTILERGGQFDVVAEAADGDGLREALETNGADVALIDLSLCRPDAFEAAAEIAGNGGRPRALLLGQRNDSRYVARALHAGAAGYLLKDRAYEELAKAIRRIAGGGIYISPGVAGIAREE